MTDIHVIYEGPFQKSFLDDLVANGYEPGTLFGMDRTKALDAYVDALTTMDNIHLSNDQYYQNFARLAMHLAGVHKGFADLLRTKLREKPLEAYPRRARLLVGTLQ